MALSVPAPRVLADYASHTRLTQVALVVGGAVFVGLCAQVAIPLPFTPVPLTLQTFAVLLVGAGLGSLRGVLSMLLYVAAGLAGVPWFAQGGSGITTPTGSITPTLGYLVGFVIAAYIVGRLAERGATRTVVRTAGLMVLGNLAIYVFGVTWLKFAIDVSWIEALSLGVVPFLIGDLIKIAAAAGLLPAVWRVLQRDR